MIDAFLSLGHTYVRMKYDILREKISKSKFMLSVKMKVIVLTFSILTYIGEELGYFVIGFFIQNLCF